MNLTGTGERCSAWPPETPWVRPLSSASPERLSPVTEIVGGGPFNLRAGQWTDDTSMALCLAESLIECRGFDPVDQLQRYVDWRRNGHLSCNGRCFDIGNTTKSALSAFERSGRPSGLTTPDSAGNGSIMRLAPIPMFFANNMDAAVDFGAQSSATTHAASEATGACRYMAALILRALLGAPKDEILSFRLPGELPRGIARVANGSFKTAHPAEIKGSGYVVESLEAALWAFNNSDNFADGARLAVNLGDDADTTGAVYGQVAGAFYGESGMPERWVGILAEKDLIVSFATQLYELRPAS